MAAKEYKLRFKRINTRKAAAAFECSVGAYYLEQAKNRVKAFLGAPEGYQMHINEYLIKRGWTFLTVSFTDAVLAEEFGVWLRLTDQLKIDKKAG